MAEKVLRDFVDKNTKKLYRKDSEYKGTEERLNELRALGLLPNEESAESKNVDSLNKDEIKEILDEKGIEYTAKATKPELVALLKDENEEE